ncbi:RING-type domain-containing protein [Chloropicon primus]|uniref:RING-type E3 ubiquitin transferase n=1 Tax=Chloropicon primus TaxID=1764295 RepID=A0A5B8MHX3_9CHLO|nr:hypothetical protein A3770_03p25550 [Chloropicon primus]UPQ99249.1 RING-type domain-containing protein [Chloropicon primus]|mmetsp:Transcript_10666/g.30066  ORF Transcript_10666/g.30066 Transcript_10666/m.30066 type:complete len:342 (+) Transcript_10666:272-1297(+)|eukprot:QDZ20037.1 hypothetical protein A3770_03p25550 [Chloropicon primus]
MGASSSRSSTVVAQRRHGPEDQSGFTVVNSNQQGYQPATVYNNGPGRGRVQYTQQQPGGFYGQPQPQQPQPQQATEKKKTKTIRNDVNLKKHTLKMVQDESDPSVYYPTFKFDCGAPCSVSVFFLATESSSEKLRLRTSVQSPGKRVFYEKQLGCTFPPENMDKSEYKSYGIVPAAYVEEQLSTVEANDSEQKWPICIRLECVSADQALQDHSLSDLPVGSPMLDWVQSQTTYAVLEKHESSYSVKVHKQKIWVQNMAYELQEIYGLENANAREGAVTGTPADDLGRECVICMSEPRDTTLLPCRHMCLCHDCAQMLRQQTNKCPICRTQVKSLLEITLKN